MRHCKVEYRRRDTHVWVVNMVESWVPPVDESLRGSDLADKAEKEKDEGVHCDRPAMDMAEG